MIEERAITRGGSGVVSATTSELGAHCELSKKSPLAREDKEEDNAKIGRSTEESKSNESKRGNGETLSFPRKRGISYHGWWGGT